MKLMAGIVGGAAALLVTVTGALAQTGTGCGVGVQTDFSLATTAVTVPMGGTVDGIGSESSRPGIGANVGCGIKLGTSPFVIGAFADYNSDNVKFSVTPVMGTGFSAALTNNWDLGVRLGWQVGPTLPYVLAAYAHTDASHSAIPLIGLSTPGSFHGYSLGGGVEFPIAKFSGVGLTLSPEVKWTQYNSENVTYTHLGTTTTVLKLEPEELTAMLRLKVVFGVDAPAARAAPLK